MSTKYTNNTNIGLSVGVFLATDNYDHNPDPKNISATSLIRPVKQTILASRVNPEHNQKDIVSTLKSRMGTAIHEGLEKAWMYNYAKAMQSLGYPQKIIDQIKINPSSEELTQDTIPVYLEQRSSKQIGEYTVSGKFDIVLEGRLEDLKTTSVYTYVYKSNDKQYQLQGSIYRWLNPEIITNDYMLIQYIFTDWSANDLKKNPSKYPPNPQLAYKIPLLSIAETDIYVNNKINLLQSLWDAPEDRLPECTDAELWRTPSVWKYYKNPLKKTRSTRTVTTQEEAYSLLAQDNYVGEVVEIKGEVKACAYCDAYAICKQKDRYFP